MKKPILLALLLFAAVCFPALAQTAPREAEQPSNYQQVLALYTRGIQLMESTMFAVPDLRAAAPLLEMAKQMLVNLRIEPHARLVKRRYLNNLRAYLALSDVVPRPVPFPEEGERQFAELRQMSTRLDTHFQALIELKDRQLRNPDPDNLARYAEIDARTGPPQPLKPRVIFLGDSITEDWRLNEYFPDRDFLNRGIAGQITSQMLGRMKPDVLDLRPAALLILGGINDIGLRTPLNVTESNLMAICDLADFAHIKVILATALPVTNDEMTRAHPPDQIRALNQWLQTFCAQHGYTFLDYYSEMVDASGQMKADLTYDGLHPNSTGYRIMAPLALAAINKTVTIAAAPQQKPKRRKLF